jgi:hypothetical protein
MAGTETVVLLKSRPEPDPKLGALIKTYLGKTWPELTAEDYNRILAMFVNSNSPTSKKAASLTAAALVRHLETQTGCTIGTLVVGWTTGQIYLDFTASSASSFSKKESIIKVVFTSGAKRSK